MRLSRNVFLALAVVSLAVAAPVAAIDFVVTRYDDPFPNGCLPGDCALREAALDADASPGLDRILLSAGTYALSRFGPGDDDGDLGDLDLHDEVEIVGAGATMTTISSAGLGTASHEPVISLFAAALVRDLKVTGGQEEGLRVFGADVTIERCDVTNNSFQGNGAAVHATGGGELVIRDSSIINNGNGVFSIGGTLTMENVTFFSNNSFQIFVDQSAVLKCTHCTIVDTVGGNPEVRVSNAIAFFANSVVSGVCETIAGGVIGSLGGNVESPGHSCLFTLASDRRDEPTAGLSALGDFGGPTRTFSLLAGSPALALVEDAECSSHDQRGVVRSPHPFESCDSSAFESSGAAARTPIFADGFLQGDAEAWSDEVP